MVVVAMMMMAVMMKDANSRGTLGGMGSGHRTYQGHHLLKEVLDDSKLHHHLHDETHRNHTQPNPHPTAPGKTSHPPPQSTSSSVCTNFCQPF